MKGQRRKKLLIENFFPREKKFMDYGFGSRARKFGEKKMRWRKRKENMEENKTEGNEDPTA